MVIIVKGGMLMATESLDLWDIYNKLKYNFLFKDDINSIYILLNLYYTEENIDNIYPQYVCLGDIKKKIRRELKGRNDRNLVTNSLGLLIHEDVDRLELCFYLEGYKYGYYNNKWINQLEKEAIKYYGIENIYTRKYLFHYEDDIEDIRKLKNGLEREIDILENENKYIENNILKFFEKKIKGKVFNLNMYIDRQLKFELKSNSLGIKEEGHIFNCYELDALYNIIYKETLKSIKKIYKNAAWFATNDKVLKRYD